MGTQITLFSLLIAFGGILVGVNSEETKNYQGILSTLTKLPQRLVAHVNYFDKINVDARLSDLPFVENQIKCLIYDGPCDHFGTRARGKYNTLLHIISHFSLLLISVVTIGLEFYAFPF